MVEGMRSPRWGYVRIMAGTLLGGMLGFYLMHRAELSYKERWNERLRIYEEELTRKNKEMASSEFFESSNEFLESSNEFRESL